MKSLMLEGICYMNDASELVTVWAATSIEGRPPLHDIDREAYGVAWVERQDGTRLQVLVAELPVPAPETTVRLHLRVLGDEEVLECVALDGDS
jgi:hypothetical protein